MENNLLPMPAIDILKFVCRQMDEMQIAYFITGGIAMSLYGTARFTRDIDIVINLKSEDSEKFVKIFEKKFYINAKTVKDEILRNGMFNVISQTSNYKIDFILKKPTAFTESEFNRRRKLRFLDFDVWVVSLEDLILSKLIWIQDIYSELQERDILWITESTSVDSEYIKLWIKNLNLKTYKLKL